MRHRLRDQCLPCPGRPVQEDALRGLDSHLHVYLRFREGVLDCLPHFLDLLRKPADLAERHLRGLFEFHDADPGIEYRPDDLHDRECVVDGDLGPGLELAEQLVVDMGEVLLVVALLAEVDLPLLQEVHDDGNEERHALELVVLAFQLRILPKELVVSHLQVEDLGLEVLDLQMDFDLGIGSGVLYDAFFHATLISGLSYIYVV